MPGPGGRKPRWHPRLPQRRARRHPLETPSACDILWYPDIFSDTSNSTIIAAYSRSGAKALHSTWQNRTETGRAPSPRSQSPNRSLRSSHLGGRRWATVYCDWQCSSREDRVVHLVLDHSSSADPHPDPAARAGHHRCP